jgi:hypothetical protein
MGQDHWLDRFEREQEERESRLDNCPGTVSEKRLSEYTLKELLREILRRVKDEP